MRSIKFRAWDNLAKTMLELVTVGCTRKDKWNPLYIQDGFINGIDHSDYIVMQHTGLTDKNGKEIYEGDIVECFVNGNSYVSFKGGAYGLIFDYSFIPFSDVYGEMKVIGNIYEHPHLLEESP